MHRRADNDRVKVPPSRISPLDLAGEAMAGILRRPARSALTTLGTVLGIGALVAILGLTVTAGGAVNAHFDALAATEVTVKPIPKAGLDEMPSVFPPDADRRIASINGVTSGGILWTVPFPDAAASVTTTLLARDMGEPLPVVGATPGALAAVRAQTKTGRIFDEFHNARRERVAVLGKAVAVRLGIHDLTRQPAIFIGAEPLTVIGIIEHVERRADLLLSVIVPHATAGLIWDEPVASDAETMVVGTELGAAQQVAIEAPIALRPDMPETLQAVTIPDPRALRDQVTAEVDGLFLLLAATLLIVGALGIANVTLVAVLERVSEIGLRRALGARPKHIAAQFLLESTLLGALGGLVGTSLGVVSVVLVSLMRDWTPLLGPTTALAAPLIGAGVGLAAGAFPALRAARIPPSQALRR